jgi:DNA-binding FadR family transcriptional regulator
MVGHTATLGRMLPTDPIRIPKAAVVVAGRIRRSIIEGKIQPDQALPNETELTAIYDVSRPVVREALRILESEALIKVKRGAGGGARVRSPDVGVAARYTALILQWEGTTLADLFEARAILEPAAVRRLATLQPPGALERLKQRHLEELAVVEDLNAYPVIATLFHEDVIDLAGNKTMAVLGRLILEIVEKHNRTMFAILDGEGTAVASDAAEHAHGKLIELIEAGHADAAVALWDRHLREAADLTLERLGHATVVDLLEHQL